MKVLVVGGAGFVGSTLVDRLLAEGHAVDVVDDLSTGSLANLADARADRSNDFSFHRLDVRDPLVADLLARRRPEVVYLLAAAPALPSLPALLEALHSASAGKVVVAFDARDLYGPVDQADLPLRESHPRRPGAEAAAGISALADAREALALEFTALVFGTVYGPRQPAEATVARLLVAVVSASAAAAAGVNPWSTDDLLFVDDAVDALVRAATRGDGLVVHVGTGVATSLDQVLAAVAWAHGSVPPTLPETNAPDHFAIDAARAQMQLGWTPFTDLEAGLATTLAWQST